MIFDPVKYKKFERVPIGCFEANMGADGWEQTRYVNDTSSVLLSSEVGEFVKFAHSFFKECDCWAALQKFSKKYGEQILNDNYDQISAINFVGKELDYTMHIVGTSINIFPYKKIHY